MSRPSTFTSQVCPKVVKMVWLNGTQMLGGLTFLLFQLRPSALSLVAAHVTCDAHNHQICSVFSCLGKLSSAETRLGEEGFWELIIK